MLRCARPCVVMSVRLLRLALRAGLVCATRSECFSCSACSSATCTAR
ncbi:hypothetical protein A2U01_0097907, partial [Trifolium medium]|nr:hypothetical protein [Trifolium medium]